MCSPSHVQLWPKVNFIHFAVFKHVSMIFHEFQKCFQIKTNKKKIDFAVMWLLKALAVAVLAVRKEKKKVNHSKAFRSFSAYSQESNWDCEQIQFYTLSSLWKQSCWVEHVAGVLQTPSASRSLSVQPSLHLSLQFYWAAAGMQNETVSHSVCWQCANNVHLTIATYMLEGGQAAGTKERGQRLKKKSCNNSA